MNEFNFLTELLSELKLEIKPELKVEFKLFNLLLFFKEPPLTFSMTDEVSRP